jgi:hypothetical protein
MDSMIWLRYTADRSSQRRRLHAQRHPAANGRPRCRHRLYSQRCREAGNGTHIILGGIEGQPATHRALRLLVRQGAPLHRRSMQKSDLLYGSAERALVEIAACAREPITASPILRGTYFDAPAGTTKPARAGSRD